MIYPKLIAFLLLKNEIDNNKNHTDQNRVKVCKHQQRDNNIEPKRIGLSMSKQNGGRNHEQHTYSIITGKYSILIKGDNPKNEEYFKDVMK